MQIPRLMRCRQIQAVLASTAVFGITLVVLFAWTANSSADVTYSFITNFVKNLNDQTNLQWTFPEGLFTASNSFATPFNITGDTNGKNFRIINSNTGLQLVITNIGLANVTTVYSLMNAESPVAGPLATVEFIGDAGADQVFTLSGGVNIRDFYAGSWQNSINGTTTKNAYQIENAQGAASTGNSATGFKGTYRLDEQVYTLTNTFLGQNLNTIVISNVNSVSAPFVVALTAQQITRPTLSISSYPTGGVSLFWPNTIGGFHLQQNPTFVSTNWVNCTTSNNLVNGTNQVIVPSLSNQLYFRLIAP